MWFLCLGKCFFSRTRWIVLLDSASASALIPEHCALLLGEAELELTLGMGGADG